MKFLVRDTQRSRHRKIRGFLTAESATISVLLACVDFEWTVRRGIYALGTSPIRALRAEFISGLKGYALLWNREVSVSPKRPLEEVVGNWGLLQQAMQLRNAIVHGAEGAVGVRYASPRVETLLAASVAVADYSRGIGVDLYRVLRRARRPRTEE
ncbi:MAG: hypothetical protein FJ361_03590 [Gemmatimonadetes bacterium]|nr:hypothetical protein [Gemmatimonadota bacterium]